MDVPELLFAMKKMFDKEQQADFTERRTVNGYTVSRFGEHFTQQVKDVLAYVRSDGRVSRSIATRLPQIEAKWEKCRAEKGNRRQMKIEARQAYYRQYQASRRARIQNGLIEGSLPQASASTDVEQWGLTLTYSSPLAGRG